MLHRASILSNKNVKTLEKYLRPCLQLMLPILHVANSDSSKQWLSSVEDVHVRFSALCLRYTTKIQCDDAHLLHPYTTTSRTSKHSGRIQIKNLNVLLRFL